MARRIMDHVDDQVANLWGTERVWQDGIPIDADDAVYTRENIRHWLLRWHELGQLASMSIKWAQILADIHLALASLPEPLRDFCELYYVIGYTAEEVLYGMEWRSYRSFANACSTIERALCKKLLDRQIMRVELPQRICAVPAANDYHPPVGPRNMAM